MKITKSQLKEIIKEELQSVLKEQKIDFEKMDHRKSGPFVNNNTQMWLVQAKKTKSLSEKVNLLLQALENLNGKNNGIYPRIQEIIWGHEDRISDLERREEVRLKARGASDPTTARGAVVRGAESGFTKGICTPEKFKEEFRKARTAGKKNFTFCGKQFSTELK
tara:strand:+ start:6148 stop:6639 length:492 start_codon:yes stop_codon:yes gene_type:complete